MRFCFNCGREISEFAKVCPYCGTTVVQQQAAPAAQAAPVRAPMPETQPANYAPQQPSSTYVRPQVNVMTSAPVTEANLPPQYKPLGAWAYFGLSLLYAIPIVGFVFMIVFSFSKGNINRRSFTRSFWIPLMFALIAVIVILILLAAGVSIGSLDSIEDLF